MPGKIIDVQVNVGDKVSKGDPIMVLEAMKMENQIIAEYDGTVASIAVAKGDIGEPRRRAHRHRLNRRRAGTSCAYLLERNDHWKY